MSLSQRYGDDELRLEVANDIIELQLAHRSVRRFTPEPVLDSELAAIVAAAQSASTSSNLQSWSVVAVREPEHKARLAGLAGDQDFIRQAPLFLLWIADLSRARRLAGRAQAPLEAPDYLEGTLLGVIDAALAAQNALIAAESLGLGGVYVGAARNHPEQIAAELGLPDGAAVVFGMAVGHPDPSEPAGVKPRLPQAAVLHHERYDTAAADREIALYDQRLSGYNAAQGLPGNWSDRVVQRLAGPRSMAGRHRLREQLERLGLPSR